MGSYIPGKYLRQMVRSYVLFEIIQPLVFLIHLCILASKIMFCILSYWTITTATSQESMVCQQMTPRQLVYRSYKNCFCLSPERLFSNKKRTSIFKTSCGVGVGRQSLAFPFWKEGTRGQEACRMFNTDILAEIKKKMEKSKTLNRSRMISKCYI